MMMMKLAKTIKEVNQIYGMISGLMSLRIHTQTYLTYLNAQRMKYYTLIEFIWQKEKAQVSHRSFNLVKNPISIFMVKRYENITIYLKPL